MLAPAMVDNWHPLGRGGLSNGGVHGGKMFEPKVHPLIDLSIEQPWQVLLLLLLHVEFKVLLRVDSRAPIEVCNLLIIHKEHLPFIHVYKCISMALEALSALSFVANFAQGIHFVYPWSTTCNQEIF